MSRPPEIRWGGDIYSTRTQSSSASRPTSTPGAAHHPSASNRLVVLAGQGHTHAAPHQAAHHIVRITYRGQNLASLQVLFEEGRLRPRHQDLCFDGSLEGHAFDVRDGNDRRLAAIGVEDGIGFVADPIVSPQKHGTLSHRGSPLLYLSIHGGRPSTPVRCRRPHRAVQQSGPHGAGRSALSGHVDGPAESRHPDRERSRSGLSARAPQSGPGTREPETRR